MLESLLVQNFQCHEKLRVDFDEHITCFIGPSDCGKSAVIRALRWLTTNSPAGDSFVKHGEKGCTIKLSLDGTTITRKRGGSINEYRLGDEALKAMGQGVPDSISDTLNMNEINFQGQHDAPFWFSETAGQVSRNLNSIIDLSLIDESLYRINQTYKQARTDAEVAEKYLRTRTAHRDELKWVVDADAAYRPIEKLSEGFDVSRNARIAVSELIDGANRDIGLRDGCLSLDLALGGMITLGDSVVTATQQRARLEELIEEIEELQAIPNPDYSQLTKTAEAFSATQSVADQLDDLLEEITDDENELEKHRQTLKRLEKNLHEATEGICPLCHQPIPTP